MGALGLVLLGGEQILGIGDLLHLDNPGAVGILVQLLGGVQQFLVHFAYRAGDGADQVAHRLDGFHIAEGLAGGGVIPHFGQVHKDHVTQLALGKVGNADDGDAVLHAEPFVVTGVLQFCGIIHDFYLRSWF